MKLLLIVPSFHPYIENGGPIIFLYKLLKNLSKKNIKITVLTSKYSYLNKKYILKDTVIINKNYKIKYYPITCKRFSFRLCLQILKKINNYDFIYYNSFFNIYLIIILLFAKKKIFISPRGQTITTNIKKKRFYLKKVFLKIVNFYKNKIFYIFSSNYEYLNSDLLRVCEKKIIPNASSFVPLKVNEKIFGIKKNNKVKKIITISRLSKRKNIDLVIKAAMKFRSFQFEIYGPDFGELNNLKTLIKENNIKNIQIFNPLNQDQIKSKLINSYIFLLPSENENFGNVFLESIQHYVPIIFLKGSYWDEINKKYKVGIGVMKNFDDIVNKIKYLDTNYTKFKLSSFEKVQKIHDPDIIAEKIYKLFYENYKKSN